MHPVHAPLLFHLGAPPGPPGLEPEPCSGLAQAAAAVAAAAVAGAVAWAVAARSWASRKHQRRFCFWDSQTLKAKESAQARQPESAFLAALPVRQVSAFVPQWSQELRGAVADPAPCAAHARQCLDKVKEGNRAS